MFKRRRHPDDEMASKDGVSSSTEEAKLEEPVVVDGCTYCRNSRVFRLGMGAMEYFLDPCPYCSETEGGNRG